jgi:hypothetical protein
LLLLLLLLLLVLSNLIVVLRSMLYRYDWCAQPSAPVLLPFFIFLLASGSSGVETSFFFFSGWYLRTRLWSGVMDSFRVSLFSFSFSLCVWHMVRPTSTHYITRRDL